MRLLVTRPEADAVRSARALTALGHETVIAPLLEIRSIGANIPDESPQAVLATSANAIRAMAGRLSASRLKASPLLVVGEATAIAAREAGWVDVHAADGDAAALAALVRATLEPAGGPLLHLSGHHVAADLSDMLAPAGFTVARSVVYESVAVGQLPDAARRALEDDSARGVLVYSPRTGRVLIDLASQAGLFAALAGISHYCLSEAIAAPLRAAGIVRVLVAGRPDEAAMLRLLDTGH